MNEEETTHNPRAEWISFGIFVAVLVIVMLVVAVSRPLIFGRIVPAVIGDSSPRYGQATPAEQPEEAPQETVPAEAPAEEVTPPEEPAEETTSDEPAPEQPAEESLELEDTETVEEPAATDTDTTQPTTTTDTEEAPTTNTAADQPESAAGANSFTYTVRAGDTLYQIARRYGTTSEEIIAASDSLNSLEDVIVPGMELTIPRR